MQEILNDPLVQSWIQDFVTQRITLVTGLVWLLIAVSFSIIGGAVGGVFIAGKDLGPRLAAMIGGLYGPAAMIPAAGLGFLLIRFVQAA